MQRDAIPHEPVLSSLKHPMHKAMLELVAASPSLKELYKQVRSNVVRKTPTCYDHVALKASLDPALLDSVRASIRAALAKESVKPAYEALPRPPANKDLYGRVSVNTPIVDVGGGDGKRLVNFHSARIAKIVDPCPGNISAAKKLEKNFEPADADGKVITSFNALVQGDPPLSVVVENLDGIHIVPDHEKMLRTGVLQQQDGKLKGFGFEDTYVPPEGEEFGFYRGFNTYSSEALVFKTGTVHQQGSPLSIFGERAIRHIPAGESTYKYSGEFLELSSRSGKGRAVSRDGRRWPLASNAADATICVEVCRDEAFLVAVKRFRGVRPFHSLDQLEKFVRKKKPVLQYQGKTYRLRAPERVDENRYDKLVEQGTVEGRVYRVNGKDILAKEWLTFSVDAGGSGILGELLRKRGFPVEAVHCGRGVEEFQLFFNGKWQLRSLGVKNKYRPDGEENILEKLRWPFLGGLKA